MSKNINVNPDHYKGAGRERQGEDILQTEHKRKYAGIKPQAPGKPGPRSAPPKKTR